MICISFFHSGNYATIISHNVDAQKTKLKLPSGNKKTVSSVNRAMIGMLSVYLFFPVFNFLLLYPRFFRCIFS